MDNKVAGGLCIMALMFGGWASSFGSEQAPKVVTVTKPGKVVTKTVTVTKPAKMPQSCFDLLAALTERDELNSKYQAEVVAGLTDIPDQLSVVGYGDNAQVQLNDIQSSLIKINQADSGIQVDLHANLQHIKIYKSACKRDSEG